MMWLFDYFKKKLQALKGPTLQEVRLPPPMRPAPPMPRVKPSRPGEFVILDPNEEVSTIIWPWAYASEETPKDVISQPEQLTGQGGTFDGGGSSGDWHDETTAVPSNYESPLDSSYSDSSLSYDTSSPSFD